MPGSICLQVNNFHVQLSSTYKATPSSENLPLLRGTIYKYFTEIWPNKYGL